MLELILVVIGSGLVAAIAMCLAALLLDDF
jgi:hypothetical protein